MILCLETAFDTCSVALFDLTTNQLMAERLLAADRKHTELILPMVEKLLLETSVCMGELDAIAFNRGPGAFTGLRINTATAQGLATALGIGCIPVSSLRAIAQSSLTGLKGQLNQGIVSVIDARMDEFYLASYQLDETQELKEIDNEQLMTVDAAAQWLAHKKKAGFYIVSPEATRINAALSKQHQAQIVVQQPISAADIGAVALKLAPKAPHLAQPVYLRHNAWKTTEQQNLG